MLTQKFELGLFEAPFVDREAVAQIVTTAEATAEGLEAQQQAVVVLTSCRTPTLVPDDVV